MDLCSVEFYVERAKISGTFNHGAFWNKLNIYPGARWKKPTTTIKKIIKKRQQRTFFGLYRGEISLGIQNQAALSNIWVFIDLFGTFFDIEKEKVFYYIIIFSPVWCFSLTATRDSRPVFVFFGMVELSSLSPPHWAQISALWRQVNVTKHAAICSTVMHHRLTACLKSALCWVHAPTACAVCTWGIFTLNETFR